MKVRMRFSVSGTFYGIEAGVERGQILDMHVQHAARELRLGRAELELEGPIGRHEKPAGEELAAIEARIAMEEQRGTLRDKVHRIS